MPNHQQASPCLDPGPKRPPLHRLEPFAIEVEDGKLVVRIDCRLALAREMFEGCGDAGGLQPDDHRRGHARHHLGALAEGSDT